MIRLPFIQHAVERALVIEISIALIDWQPGGRKCDQCRSGATPDRFMVLARCNDDQLMTEARRGTKLRVNIGPHAAAGGRIESAHVDDPHGAGPQPVPP